MAMSAREANRAERFEDEKRRIIDSCFGKRDEDGSSEQHQSLSHPGLALAHVSADSPSQPSRHT